MSVFIIVPTTTLSASKFFLLHTTSAISMLTTIRSRRLSRQPKCHNNGININITILLFYLVEVLDILDWSINKQSLCPLANFSSLDKCDSWVFLAQKIQTEDAANLDHYIYIANGFIIQEPETYKKKMVSKQAKE